MPPRRKNPLPKSKAFRKKKHGIDLWVYDTKCKGAGLVYVESTKGHMQEFYDKKSTFIYYVIAGKGHFFLDEKKTSVKTGDVVIAPPKTKIYYMGIMKLILVTSPAWQAKNEVHVRYIKK